MIRKNKLIKLFVITIIAAVLSPHVKAAQNDTYMSFEKIEGVYYYQQDNNTGEVMSNYVTKLYANGELAYCIEPLVQITTRTYNSTTDWSYSNLSNEQKEYIELVGYFGREYPGHDNDRYWMAAQELIWEKARNINVKFTTQKNGAGEEIDISNEKREIENLINNYNALPSFAGQTIDGNMDQTITLTDTNGVLNNYMVYYNGKHIVEKDNNTLKISYASNEIGEEEVTFERPSYDDKSTVIYYNNNTQTYAKLRITNKKKFTIKLKSHGTTLKIDKKGEQLELNDASYKYNIISLPNVTFAIYANEDIKDSEGNIVQKKYSLVDSITTDKNGLAILNDMYYGKYFLIEGQSSGGNMVNNEKYYFEITKKDNMMKKIELQNYLPKGKLEFTKIDTDTNNPVPETEIQIFTEDDRLIGTYKVDDNGQVKIDNLFIGKYYIIEKTAADGYLKTDEKVYFEITDNGQTVKTYMTNKKIKQTVEVPNTNKNTPQHGLIMLILSIIGLIYGYKKTNA